MKKTFSTELAYIFGIVFLSLGTAFIQRADMGMSMVVAPAYLISLKVAEYVPWFTFGMAEICFQAFLILLLTIITTSFKLKYIFSFVTAFLYSITLDQQIRLVGLIPDFGITGRIVFFYAGFFLCAFGISMFFHSYLIPEIYELYVKEITTRYQFNITKVKTVYDCTSCGIAIIMSFAFYGWFHFVGIHIGTIVTAIANGWLIGQISDFFESRFEFKDTLKWRAFFEK